MEERIKDLLEENKKMLKKIDKEIEGLLEEEKVEHKDVYLDILECVRCDVFHAIGKLEGTEKEIAMKMFNGGSPYGIY